MHKKGLACALALELAMAAAPGAQADTTGSHPSLAAPYATASHENFSKIDGWKDGLTPTAPPGFTVTRFAQDLDSPRNAVVLPNGDVLVAEAKTEEKPNDPAYRDKGANRIRILRDADHDGVAETKEILLSGLRQPYGMVYANDRLYVADTDGVFWIDYKLGTLKVSEDVEKHVIDHFEPGGYNNHWTRNLILSPDGQALFVAIGSASNAGEYGETEEKRRANVLRIDLTTGVETVYAWGMRNPVGMAIEPTTQALWVAVNERDHLGDDLVPDYITHVEKGGFYGWPWFYYGDHEDPRLAGRHPELKGKAIVPDYAVGAHVAALGIAFGDQTTFSQHYRSGAFVGRHGSWNRADLAGYDVVFVPFSNGKPAGPIEPFLGGFISGATTVHGRPRSIAVTNDGALLVTDDATGIVWRVASALANPAR